MAYDILLKEAKDLPEDMIEQAEHTATFQKSVNPLADEFVSIADDFDKTPECFKEYV